MAIFEIEMDPDAHDPSGWSGSDVLRSIRSPEHDYYLVDLDLEVADTLRGLPGIKKFELAPDGEYVDDNHRLFQVRAGEIII